MILSKNSFYNNLNRIGKMSDKQIFVAKMLFVNRSQYYPVTVTLKVNVLATDPESARASALELFKAAYFDNRYSNDTARTLESFIPEEDKPSEKLDELRKLESCDPLEYDLIEAEIEAEEKRIATEFMDNVNIYIYTPKITCGLVSVDVDMENRNGFF
jgi:hypothetical protein